MNKMIDGKQCTTLWHVDDLKISHMDPAVVTAILNLINTDYGTISPLTVTRGKVHGYLGMTIDFSCEGKVNFTMIEYIDNILQDLPDDMRGHANTPAANHLFETNTDDPNLLDKAESNQNSSITGQRNSCTYRNEHAWISNCLWRAYARESRNPTLMITPSSFVSRNI